MSFSTAQMLLSGYARYRCTFVYFFQGLATHQMLHVSPGERGIGLQSQGADSGRDGRAGRGAGVGRGADPVGPQVPILVHGGDAGIVARSACGQEQPRVDTKEVYQ